MKQKIYIDNKPSSPSFLCSLMMFFVMMLLTAMEITNDCLFGGGEGEQHKISHWCFNKESAY